MARIEQVELDIYGQTQEGAVLMRIDRMLTFLQNTDVDGGLHLLLNLAEWGFSATLSGDKPMIDRLQGLELVLYGEQQSGTVSQRAERLMMDVWGTTKLDVKQVTLPAQTLVKVALNQTVDSGTAQVGDRIVYRITEDVMVDGRVVIPAGTTSVATVTEVTAAGRLGKDGARSPGFRFCAGPGWHRGPSQRLMKGQRKRTAPWNLRPGPAWPELSSWAAPLARLERT